MTETNYKLFSCAHCNQVFEAQREKRFCTRQCNKAFNRKAGPSMSRAEYLAHVSENAASRFICEYCKKPANRPIGGTGRKGGYKNRWCSMACRCAATLAASPPYSRVWAAYCKTCSKPFVARRKRSTCSDKCSNAAGYKPAPLRNRNCLRCGITYMPKRTGGDVSTYCGPECLAESKRKLRRVARSVRRARERGSDSERVDPYLVFARDKWRCQLCGIKTPLSKRGSYDDNAPELDHIVPLSKGGAHSYLNTQCACRKCNGDKSDRPMGQTLLFG